MLSHPEPANGLCGFFTVSELALDNEKRRAVPIKSWKIQRKGD